MKYNDINSNNKLSPQNMENIFNVYDDDGQYYFNILKSVYFPENLEPKNYTTYLVQPKDSWYLISYKHYQTTNLWWLICSVNQIINPIEQPKENTVLKILLPNVVRQVIYEINK